MRIFCLLTLLIGVASCSALSPNRTSAPSARPAASALVGVWQPQEVTQLPTRGNLLDGGMPVLGAAGPGLWIITPRYYSLIELNNGAMPRPAESDTITAAHLLAMWGPVAANAGPYDVRGDTFFTRPIVSKNPRAMRMPPGRRLFRLTGDSLWLTFLPAGTTIKYVRLDR